MNSTIFYFFFLLLNFIFTDLVRVTILPFYFYRNLNWMWKKYKWIFSENNIIYAIQFFTHLWLLFGFWNMRYYFSSCGRLWQICFLSLYLKCNSFMYYAKNKGRKTFPWILFVAILKYIISINMFLCNRRNDQCEKFN